MDAEIIAVGLACYDHLLLVPSLATVGGGAHVAQVLAQCGGMSATAAVAASKLGARVRLWTCVGSDMYGRFIVDDLRSRGVDVSEVVVVEGGRTPVSTVLVEEGTGERRFLYFPGSGPRGPGGPGRLRLEEGWDPPDCARIDRAAAVLVDGRWPGVCLAASRRAREAGVPVVPDVGHALDEHLAILRLADWPVVSEIELVEIVQGLRAATPSPGGPDAGPQHRAPAPASGARALLDELAAGLLGGEARAVIVTRGARGVWLRERGGRARTLGAFPVDVVDTTGAGDVFHGAFAWCIARGWDAERAAEYASVAAAVTCTALGGQTVAPGPEEVEKLLAGPGRPRWEDA